MNTRPLFSHFLIFRFAVGVLVALIWSSPAFCDAIHDAARDGDLAKVKLLVQANPDVVFSKSPNGGALGVYETPLHAAAGNGHKDVAEFLLANKADVNAKDGNGETPLHAAAEKGHKDVAELLLANKADVNAKSKHGRTPLHLAAEKGHKDVAELLLANKADVNANGQSGTPLEAAASGGHRDLAELLLANKADVNAKSGYGSTPLLAAAGMGHKDVAELLLANKADINANGPSGTPLGAAASGGHKDVAELLLANGADVNAKGGAYGWTPLDFAAVEAHKDKDVAELLLANGADVNAKDTRGDTPLHTAASYGDKVLAELLLANKADVNAPNDDLNTPLNVAVSRRYDDVAELLRQHGGADHAVSAITPAALFGYWRIKVDASTTHFANIDPWDAEILEFRKDGVLDVQIEAVKMSRGIYYVTARGIEIRLYRWPATEIFDYSVSNGVLTLKSTRGTQVYKYVSAE